MLSTSTPKKIKSQDGEVIELRRVIGNIHGDQPGPTAIFFAGMHGNEPAGVIALHHVIKELTTKNLPIAGRILAVAGNLPALSQGTRFIHSDLNRIWTASRMVLLRQGIEPIENDDEAQQVELYKTVRDVIDCESGPFYFMDLHTTSSDTVPFLAVNDSMLNRKFTSLYPTPIILGIEEYIDGPMLSYVNEQGYVSFGFEGGEHSSPNSVKNHIAFIYLTLVHTGILLRDSINYKMYYNQLATYTRHLHRFYEIYFRYNIHEGEQFKMAPGFINFEIVKKGGVLASSNGRMIYAKTNIQLFMPRYQKQGNDGYFAIRPIPRIFLLLSGALRKIKLDFMLPMLPGIRRSAGNSLIVNRHVAGILTKQFFHLFGYRTRSIDKDHYIVSNREFASKTEEYRTAPWFH